MPITEFPHIVMPAAPLPAIAAPAVPLVPAAPAGTSTSIKIVIASVVVVATAVLVPIVVAKMTYYAKVAYHAIREPDNTPIHCWDAIYKHPPYCEDGCRYTECLFLSGGTRNVSKYFLPKMPVNCWCEYDEDGDGFVQCSVLSGKTYFGYDVLNSWECYSETDY